MKVKLLHEAEVRTFAIVFDKGDEAIRGLTEFARDRGVEAAQITAVGSFSEVTLGYFDRRRKGFERLVLSEQSEVLSLIGDIAVDAGEPAVHAHVVLGRPDYSTRGGHLFAGVVWPTLEAIVTESPSYLRKRTDRETGLALIDLDL